MSEKPSDKGRSVVPPLIGIDLVDPAVLADRLERNPELAEELFSRAEDAYARSQRHPVQHLAARFAAKEAVVKALGVLSWDPLDIEVEGGGEEVVLCLRGEVEKRALELNVVVTISMTHIDSLAGAVALALPKPRP